MVGSVVVFTAILLAARRDGATSALRLAPLAARMAEIGGLGTLVLGVWLAIDLDNYDLLDGWVLAALVLWVIAAGAGARLAQAVAEGGDLARANVFYPVTAIAVTALLVVMIYKPGA